jgi:hypothetical protein
VETTVSCAEVRAITVDQSPPKISAKGNNAATSTPSSTDPIAAGPSNTGSHAEAPGRPVSHGTADNTAPEPITTIRHQASAGEGQSGAATDDLFRDPIQIPGCSPAVWVYPHGNPRISPCFHDRYREVINIFRVNAEDDPRLRDSVHYIDYSLRMCGTSPKDSQPSILVFCRQKEFKVLKSILTSKQLRYQYRPRQPSVSFLRSPWTSNTPLATEGKLFFALYFWRHQRPRTLLVGEEQVQIIRTAKPSGELPLSGTPSLRIDRLTLCGLAVGHRGGSGFSTLGCVITIGEMFFAITTAHASQPPHKSDKKEPESVSGSDTKHYSPSDEDYSSDDVQYDSLSEEGNDDSVPPEDSPSLEAARPTKSRYREGSIKYLSTAMFNTPDELYDNGAMDFDWAIVKLEDSRDYLPNAFLDPNDLSNLIFVSGVANYPPASETPVLVIVDQTGPLKGMLHPGVSVLGGINGKSSSAVWTMTMSENCRKTPTFSVAITSIC